MEARRIIFPPNHWTLNTLNLWCQVICRQNHIHCLDLLAQFQEQGKSPPLYILRDTHWIEAGNRLAAEAIFKYLADHNPIKAD